MNKQIGTTKNNQDKELFKQMIVYIIVFVALSILITHDNLILLLSWLIWLGGESICGIVGTKARQDIMTKIKELKITYYIKH